MNSGLSRRTAFTYGKTCRARLCRWVDGSGRTRLAQGDVFIGRGIVKFRSVVGADTFVISSSRAR
jgi:hypothetical protein